MSTAKSHMGTLAARIGHSRPLSELRIGNSGHRSSEGMLASSALGELNMQMALLAGYVAAVTILAVLMRLYLYGL